MPNKRPNKTSKKAPIKAASKTPRKPAQKNLNAFSINAVPKDATPPQKKSARTATLSTTHAATSSPTPATSNIPPKSTDSPSVLPSKKIFGVEKEIFWLGIVSFLTDISSEMIFSVLSIFAAVILGASSVVIGLMEGLADFSASSLDYVSGYLSDKTGKRKIFALLGYAFSAVAKILLIFATTVSAVITFRVVERLGKSFRGAPRDALISAIAQKSKYGFAFGFHKMLDKAGAILGPIIAYFILTFLGQTKSTFTLLFWIALIPAAAAVILMAIFVKDRPAPSKKREGGFFSSYRFMGAEFKRYLKVAGFFSLAYFSFAFLLLKANQVGFEIRDITLLYALFNVSFVLLSIPIGKMGDAIGRKKIILAEYAIYFLMSLGFIFASTKTSVILLFLLYGIFYAIDEGQSKAYISGITKDEQRASAIGIYNFITGIIYLPASLIAGVLWNSYGPSVTFSFAAVIAIISLLLFLIPSGAKKLSKTHA
jgi:MFS family permease